LIGGRVVGRPPVDRGAALPRIVSLPWIAAGHWISVPEQNSDDPTAVDPVAAGQ
jgi:hypothetical protein